jgi:hypothetical protein
MIVQWSIRNRVCSPRAAGFLHAGRRQNVGLPGNIKSGHE